MIKTFDELFKYVREGVPRKLVVPKGDAESVILACKEAKEIGVADTILIGNREKVLKICEENDIDEKIFEIIEENDDVKAVKKAIDVVKSGKASMIMKGKTDTATLLKEVLDGENGLKTDRVLSHIAVVESNNYHKLMAFTDGGLNIKPDIEKKIDILRNAVEFEKKLGNRNIKAALLAAVEKVNPKMEETVDYEKIVKMTKEKNFIDATVEGPLAMDIALDKKAAEVKGLNSNVSGDVDIFLFPEISACNIAVKSLIYLANAKVGGIVVGAKVPIVLLSRSDTPDTKLRSIALGALWDNL